MLYDDPASINDVRMRTLSKFIFQRVDSLQDELLIESPYFVPLPRGVDKLSDCMSGVCGCAC